VSQRQITIEESFAVPPERLWKAISDHEAMSDWAGAPTKVIAGPSDGGVGTVRRIGMGGLKIDEEVIYADPPRRMVYRIVRGLPLLRFHRGEILIEPWGKAGSTLRWDIILDSAVPGVARAISAALGPGLRKGLAKLRRQLARERDPLEERRAS
jgi:uncharacterized protein YndB with AHSA1/START domain